MIAIICACLPIIIPQLGRMSDRYRNSREVTPGTKPLTIGQIRVSRSGWLISLWSLEDTNVSQEQLNHGTQTFIKALSEDKDSPSAMEQGQIQVQIDVDWSSSGVKTP